MKYRVKMDIEIKTEEIMQDTILAKIIGTDIKAMTTKQKDTIIKKRLTINRLIGELLHYILYETPKKEYNKFIQITEE